MAVPAVSGGGLPTPSKVEGGWFGKDGEKYRFKATINGDDVVINVFVSKKERAKLDRTPGALEEHVMDQAAKLAKAWKEVRTTETEVMRVNTQKKVLRLYKKDNEELQKFNLSTAKGGNPAGQVSRTGSDSAKQEKLQRIFSKTYDVPKSEEILYERFERVKRGAPPPAPADTLPGTPSAAVPRPLPNPFGRDDDEDDDSRRELLSEPPH